jgi:hypothetical protein
MPSYKTHSIHGEIVLDNLDTKVEIQREDIKSFCMGPDALIATDSKTFKKQHVYNVKEYFEKLLKEIKRNKLYDNSEVMAFLYGQLDHFVLDSVMHPLIYYMTENKKHKHKIKAHGLVENWIDDYTSEKYNKKQMLYYKKWFIKDLKLLELINKLYKKVYKSKNEGLKYSFGMFATIMFDTLARTNALQIVPLIIDKMDIGDFTYKQDYKRVLPYLNLKKDTWYNPETGEKSNLSFDELWKKSIDIAIEIIDEINGYLYENKKINHPYILNDLSWNTGLPCSKGQTLRYVKKYEK